MYIPRLIYTSASPIAKFLTTRILHFHDVAINTFLFTCTSPPLHAAPFGMPFLRIYGHRFSPRVSKFFSSIGYLKETTKLVLMRGTFYFQCCKPWSSMTSGNCFQNRHFNRQTRSESNHQSPFTTFSSCAALLLS
ncbi:hypothetical protein Mapa_002232 [Marchantia paleacea]|nr:hypothetical protein Mapa_002232 [Marchantia paleacea]